MLIPLVAFAVLHLVVQGADGRRNNNNRESKSLTVPNVSTDAEAAFEIITENAAVLDADPPILPTEVPENKYLARDAGDISTSEPNKFEDEEGPLYDNVTCNGPPRVKGAKPRTRGDEHDIGTVVTYTCDSEYVPEDSNKIQSVCEFDEESGTGQWSDPSGVCIHSSSCNRPPRVEGAKTRTLGNEHSIGTVVNYTCNSGYVPRGFVRIQSVCEFDEESGRGRWSEPSGVCIHNSTCDRPPQVESAKTRTRGNEHSIGTVANYTCNSGYVRQGSDRIQSVCEFDEESARGRWSVPSGACIRIPPCNRPPRVEGAKTRIRGNKHKIGTVVNYTCDSGYFRQGSDRIQSVCEFDGESGRGRWSDPSGVCIQSTTLSSEAPENESPDENVERPSSNEPTKFGDQRRDGIPCDRPPPVEGAITPRVRDQKHDIGTVVTYHCDYGFVSLGSAKFQSVCELDEQSGKGRWSDPNVVCIPRSCGDPGYVINARRIGSVFTFPETVEFECEEGYKLNGAGVRYCQASGVWSGKLPTCEQVYCDRPRNPENGRVRYISLEYGTELRYECNKGFILSSQQTRYCSENGTWSHEDPVCMEANCNEPEAPEHGFLQLTDGLKVDSLVIYSCRDDKLLFGASTSKCLSDGQWTFPPPKCVDQCEVPYVENGKIGQYEIRRSYYRTQTVFVPFQKGKKVNPGETGILLCNKNFVPEEGSQTSEKEVTCEDGTWSMPLQCKSVSCDEDPPAIENGYPIVSKKSHGHIIFYRCDKFYEKEKTGHVECVYGRWIGYTPICADARCYANQLNIPGLVKPNKEFIAHEKDFSTTCEEGYHVNDLQKKISCKLGKWDIVSNPCIEEQNVRCPMIDDKGIFNVRYNNDRKVESAAYYYCKEESRKISDSNFRICEENGEWSGVEPECVVKAPSNSPTVTISSLSISNTKTSGTVSPPASASEKRPLTATVEPSIAESLDSQERDDCCCTSNYLNTNAVVSEEGKAIILGAKVKKGNTVQISCLYKTQILSWRNGFRVSGPVSLTCDTCQTWDETDIPSCVTLFEGDTWIVLNPNMKLLPGGNVEIRQNENVQIQCSSVSTERQIPYPEWKTSPPKTVATDYNAIPVPRGFQLNTFLQINDFKDELTGRYECYISSSHPYKHTILNLKIAAPEVRCPFLDEKDTFIINYSNSRKVNSIAHYFCRIPTQGTIGGYVRTCLESGAWTGEEPSCVDIICPKFGDDRYVDVQYSNEQYVGSVATFLCRHPRTVTGSSTAMCLGNGTWSHNQPACQLPLRDTRCPNLDDKDVFIINYSNGKKISSVARYYCISLSEKVQGSDVRTCQQNGEWSGSDPVCVEITCRKFWVFGSLTVSYSKETKVGSYADFHCTPPAVLVGSHTARCLLNGTWSNPQPSCDEPEVRCPPLDDKGIFTIRYDNHMKVNSAAHYTCKEHSDKMMGSNVRRCREDGEWFGVEPECVAPGCQWETLIKSLPPDVVPNEENVTGDLLPPGFELSLFCDNNMVLTGNNKAKCNQQGRWNLGNVQCILGCVMSFSNSPAALIIEPVKDHYRFGEFALLSCPEGFELTTEVEKVMCMGSDWSDELPDCKKIETNVQSS